MRSSLLIAALVAGLLIAAPAGADDPKPEPCRGTVLLDPAGDASTRPVAGNGLGFPESAPNLDITALFFTTRPDAAGNPKTTAHLRIANLSKTIPTNAPPGKLNYTIFWTRQSDAVFGARVAVDSAGVVTYTMLRYAATIPSAGSAGVEEVPTTGAYVPGPDGVVSVDLTGVSGAVGTALKGVYASTAIYRDPNEASFTSDRAPNGTATVEAPPHADCNASSTPIQRRNEPDEPHNGPQSTPQPVSGSGDRGYVSEPHQQADGSAENIGHAAPAAKERRKSTKAKCKRAKARKQATKRARRCRGTKRARR